MNARKLKLVMCGLVVAGGALSDRALAVVVFSENFENATNASAISVSGTAFTTTGATTGTAPPVADMMPAAVQIVSDNLGPTPPPAFASGTKYLSFSDMTANSRLLVGLNLPVDPVDPVNAPNFKQIANSGFHWSFDFFEPSGFGPSSTRVFLSGGALTDNGLRLVEFALIGDPASAGYYGPGFTLFPSGITLSENMRHHVEVMGVVGNVENGVISYNGQTESVADNTFDAWINGVKIVDNAAFRNSLASPAIAGFGFSGNNTAAKETSFFDNIVLRTDLPGATIDGDYNMNGSVDAADYVIWRKDPSGHGGTPDGYNTWRANYGVGAGGGRSLGGSAVPEPGVVALLIALYSVAGIDRRRRTSDRATCRCEAFHTASLLTTLH